MLSMDNCADKSVLGPNELATHKLEMHAEQGGCRIWGGLRPTAYGCQHVAGMSI